MTLYSIKKHSANHFILAWHLLELIKDLFGHSSEVTTQIYITNLKEINRKEILEKERSFNTFKGHFDFGITSIKLLISYFLKKTELM
jgi:integrase